MLVLILGIVCLAIILYVEGRKEKSNDYVIVIGSLIEIILIIIFIIGIVIKGVQFLFSPAPVENNDNDAILCAQQVVESILKDPSSAKFNSKQVLEKDTYNRYLVELDVSGTNGFGGVSREVYYVVVKYNSTKENFEYYTNNAVGTDKEIVKSLNNWGESE